MALKAAGAVILLLVLAAGVVALAFIFGQKLEVKVTPNGSLIDVRSLGEYQANVRRIRIADAATGQVVWELRAANGECFPLWYVEIHEGANLALPEYLQDVEVVVPKTKTYSLSSGAAYRIDLWTYKDWKVPRHVSTYFTLAKRQGA